MSSPPTPSPSTPPPPTPSDRNAPADHDEPADEPAEVSVVVRISPIAHLVTGFLALGTLIPVQAWPITAPLLVVPVLASAAIARLRTTATRTVVTTRTLAGGESVDWADIEGLRFHGGSWARAHLKDGRQLRLPAVTFATLPGLATVTGGRVPNPYR